MERLVRANHSISILLGLQLGDDDAGADDGDDVTVTIELLRAM